MTKQNGDIFAKSRCAFSLRGAVIKSSQVKMVRLKCCGLFHTALLVLLVPLLSRLWGHNKLEVCRCFSLTAHVTNVLSGSLLAELLWVHDVCSCPCVRALVPLPLPCPGRSSSMNPSLSATDKKNYGFFSVSKRSCVQSKGSTYCERWNKINIAVYYLW